MISFVLRAPVFCFPQQWILVGLVERLSNVWGARFCCQSGTVSRVGCPFPKCSCGRGIELQLIQFTGDFAQGSSRSVQTPTHFSMSPGSTRSVALDSTVAHQLMIGRYACETPPSSQLGKAGARVFTQCSSWGLHYGHAPLHATACCRCSFRLSHFLDCGKHLPFWLVSFVGSLHAGTVSWLHVSMSILWQDRWWKARLLLQRCCGLMQVQVSGCNYLGREGPSQLSLVWQTAK